MEINYDALSTNNNNNINNFHDCYAHKAHSYSPETVPFAVVLDSHRCTRFDVNDVKCNGANLVLYI